MLKRQVTVGVLIVHANITNTGTFHQSVTNIEVLATYKTKG